MNARRRAATAIAVCTLAFSLAAGARYLLIEPAHITFQCDGGSSEAWCTVRSWIIQAFVHQRIGWVALALASAALVIGWLWMTALALFIACAGLILYTTELCAPAALLALIVIVRRGHNTTAASSKSSTP